jgi:hypothetical protein
MFDIVHCVNALDHTNNPQKAIEEMKRICKPGGWIYLRHAPNQKDKYGGIHKWNATVDGFENSDKNITLDGFETRIDNISGEDVFVFLFRKKEIKCERCCKNKRKKIEDKKNDNKKYYDGAKDLSILIPARNEEFLAKTIENILENIEADTDIIAVLDGEWANPSIPQNERVKVVYLPESIGQRAATNLACRLSNARYVMKVDAHCSFDKGFDRKMIAEMKDDYTMVPMMYNLHAFDWVCKNGHRRYQGPSGKCTECGEPTKKEIIWKPRKTHCTWSWYFDKDLRFQYLGGAHKTPKEKDVVETMSLLGACFMLTREKYWELDISSEEFGSWGQQGTEVACKTWLSGGKLMVNRKTWFSHMFRTQGGDFSFPYPQSGKEVRRNRDLSKELFLHGKWKGAKKPLDWLIKKFNPPTWGATKVILYYTDNRLKWSIARACREQIKKIGLPVVSVSHKPANLGKNILFKGEPGVESMFRQILLGLENTEADIVFLAEHDVLYHPSHFDFEPKDDNFYFNNNVWKVRYEDGFAIKYNECLQLSGMCGKRDVLREYFKDKVKQCEDGKFDRHYEPTKNRKVYQSEFPIVDIRHKTNQTANRWKIDQFKNKPTGWQEGVIPDWAKNIKI